MVDPFNPTAPSACPRRFLLLHAFQPSRVQMVYDLFVSTWNKHRTAKNGRPPPPSYAMFVGTWTRNFEHVILKRRQIKPRREQGQGQEQEQQYGGLHSSPPATCQIREKPISMRMVREDICSASRMAKG